MPTSSLLSVARLIGPRGLKAMGAAVGVPAPISARRLIDRASTKLLGSWSLLTGQGIEIDNAAQAWHAGHVEDVFPLDRARVLLASHTGGVWLATRDGSSVLPLSNGWGSVDMHCLAAGSRGPAHVYAAGVGALYETAALSLRALFRFKQTNSFKALAGTLGQSLPVGLRQLLALAADAPLFDWRPIPLRDAKGESLWLDIRQMVTFTGSQPPKLVLAADEGVYWSDVPPLDEPYRFTRAIGMPRGQCLAVALSATAPGQTRSIVCSPTGNIVTPASNGLYVGSWQGADLVMQRAVHLGNVDFVQWQYAVVASSSGNRSVLYAAVSASGTATLSLKAAFLKASMKVPPFRVSQLAQVLGVNPPGSIAALIRKVAPPQGHDFIYAVLGSTDGGRTWAPVGPRQKVEESILLPRDPGQTQEGYNLSIAVSHVDPNLIALGWRIGPWIGRATPHAFVWEEHGDAADRPGFSPHIHSDSHGLYFDPHDATGRTLLACSDGGLIISSDLAATFASPINRSLPNLQFQSYPGQSGGTNGASGVSPHTPRLAVGALQDNGVVYSSAAGGVQGPWRRIVGGDGIVSLVLEHDQLLYWFNSDPPTARIAKWSGTQPEAAVEVPVRTASPTLPAGRFLSNPFGEPVLRPAFRRPGTQQRMFAMAACDALGTAGELWGLYADDDGGNAGWDFIAALNLPLDGSVSAMASDDGSTLLVGTTNGLIFSCDVATGTLRPMRIDPALAGTLGAVYQLAPLPGGAAAARFTGRLLRYDSTGATWTAVPGNGLPTDEGSFYFIAVDGARQPSILYAATDFSVHASWDFGANWLPVGTGLPIRCHPATLRFVAQPDGVRILYLFTYGRSVWRARLS